MNSVAENNEQYSEDLQKSNDLNDLNKSQDLQAQKSDKYIRFVIMSTSSRIRLNELFERKYGKGINSNSTYLVIYKDRFIQFAPDEYKEFDKFDGPLHKVYDQVERFIDKLGNVKFVNGLFYYKPSSFYIKWTLSKISVKDGSVRFDTPKIPLKQYELVEKLNKECVIGFFEDRYMVMDDLVLMEDYASKNIKIFKVQNENYTILTNSQYNNILNLLKDPK